MEIRDFETGDLNWVFRRHGALYAQSEGFDASFERLVANILHDFIATHDPATERGWIAHIGARRLGSIFCTRPTADIAKLRLFLVEPDARGTGLAQNLLTTCLSHAKTSGATRMSLWTHESHVAACRLYAKNGFHCTASKAVHSFGVDLIEQQWEIALQ